MAYTTDAHVRECCTKFTTDPNPPTLTITHAIAKATARINATARTTFTDAQAANTIIEQIATDLAAFYCLAWDPAAFTSNSQAALTANMLYEAAMAGLEQLKDQRTVEYLTQ